MYSVAHARLDEPHEIFASRGLPHFSQLLVGREYVGDQSKNPIIRDSGHRTTIWLPWWSGSFPGNSKHVFNDFFMRVILWTSIRLLSIPLISKPASSMQHNTNAANTRPFPA